MTFQRRWAVATLALVLGTAAGCSKDVKIGAVISETGPVASYGQQVRRGLDLALEEIAAAGGFQDGQVLLLYRDDGSQADKGVAAVRELIENEGARLLIGAISSRVTLAIAPICEAKEVLLLSPSASAPSITEAGKYVLRNYPSDVLEGTAMADFARDHGLHRVAVFALDDEFGRGLEKVFTKGFESGKREIVATYHVHQTDPALDPAAERERQSEELKPMVEEVQSLGPEGIYIIGYLDETVELLKQLQAAGVKGLRMATSSVTDPVLRQAGDAAESLVFSRPIFDIDSSQPATAGFVRAFRAKYDENPDIYAAHGYDALKLLWQAMLDTGSSYPDDVRRGLLGLKNYIGAAGRTAFDERGDVVRYPQLFVVHEGRPVKLDEFEQQGGELSVPGES